MTAPGPPSRNIPIARPPAHSSSARSAPRHRGVRRPGGSALLGAPPPPPRPPPCGGSSLLPPGRGCAAARLPAPRFLPLRFRASGHDRPDRAAATGAGMTPQSPATPQRHEQSAPTRPDQGHGGGTRADTVSAWLILSDCRAHFVSQHASPVNRVMINLSVKAGQPQPSRRQSGPVRMAREVVRLDGSQLGLGRTLRVTFFASL